jgi:hypothetical protein
MYATKTIHKNINPNYKQAYISIGDPYKTNQGEIKMFFSLGNTFEGGPLVILKNVSLFISISYL